MKHSRQLTGPLVKAALLGLLSLAPTACGDGTSEPSHPAQEVGSTTPMTFDAFMSHVYKEPWEGGAYIYNGDTPALSIEELKQAHAQMTQVQQGLAVNRVSGRDDVWSASQKLNLRYCVGNSFGPNKPSVVSAMAAAAAAWEQYALVDFIYDSAQDANCTNTNTAVTFDVNMVSVNGAYLARAFFPSFPRSSANIYLDISAFFQSTYSLEGLLKHELGHVLGFRHEHTRPEAGQCFEDSSWRGITPYDGNSVMHYPQCGGINSNFSYLSTSDVEGAASLYGSRKIGAPVFPGGCGLIASGKGLGINQGMYSCDGRFLFILQGDGNLVLYQGSKALWVSGTAGQPSHGAYMQTDGNFVIYTGLPRAIFNTRTAGNNGAYLAVQNDGNVVIYNTAGRALWLTNTGGR